MESKPMESKQRWQDWTALVLGAWLFLAPFVTSYGPLSGTAAWNSYIIGATVVIFAAWALVQPEKWEEWVNLVLGAWLIIAPFALGFYASLETAAWNQIVVGVLIAADAIWVLAARPSSGGMAAHHH